MSSLADEYIGLTGKGRVELRRGARDRAQRHRTLHRRDDDRQSVSRLTPNSRPCLAEAGDRTDSSRLAHRRAADEATTPPAAARSSSTSTNSRPRRSSASCCRDWSRRRSTSAARVGRVRAGLANDGDGFGVEERGRADRLADAQHEPHPPGRDHEGDHRGRLRRGGRAVETTNRNQSAGEGSGAAASLFSFADEEWSRRMMEKICGDEQRATVRGRLWRYGPLVVWVGFVSSLRRRKLLGVEHLAHHPAAAALALPRNQRGVARLRSTSSSARPRTSRSTRCSRCSRRAPSSRRRARGSRRRWWLAAFALVACARALDEYHQSFVPARTGTIYDSLLDIGGRRGGARLRGAVAESQAAEGGLKRGDGAALHGG